MKDIRSRYFEIILYKDFPNYVDFLDNLNKNYNIIYILHDRDTYLDDSNDHVKGEIKKEHFHILFRFENARYKSAFCNEINYFDNLVSPINNYKKFLLYMIHFKDPIKFNYNVNDLKGSSILINQAIDLVNNQRGECEEISILIDYINNCDWLISIEEICSFALNNNIWSCFRRNYSILKSYLNSHNYKIDSRNNMKGGKYIEK